MSLEDLALDTLEKTADDSHEAVVDELVKEDVQIRLDEGRGVLGLVDPELPAAIRKLNPSNRK